MRRIADDNPESSRIMLGLLGAVEQDRARSQRHLASKLGIALGLMNACVRRRIKGPGESPPGSGTALCLLSDPLGFAEKSRITLECGVPVLFLRVSARRRRTARSCSCSPRRAGCTASFWSGNRILPRSPRSARWKKGFIAGLVDGNAEDIS
jgi:hypothetical protein